MATYRYNEVKSTYGMAEIQIVLLNWKAQIQGLNIVIALPNSKATPPVHDFIVSPLNFANQMINVSD
jgi:hypothetical protein